MPLISFSPKLDKNVIQPNFVLTNKNHLLPIWDCTLKTTHRGKPKKFYIVNNLCQMIFYFYFAVFQWWSSGRHNIHQNNTQQNDLRWHLVNNKLNMTLNIATLSKTVECCYTEHQLCYVPIMLSVTNKTIIPSVFLCRMALWWVSICLKCSFLQAGMKKLDERLRYTLKRCFIYQQ